MSFRRNRPTTPEKNPKADPAPSQGSAEDAALVTFKHVVAGIQDYLICLLDTGGYVESWNVGAERITGFRAQEVLGRRMSMLYPDEAVASGWPDDELKLAAGSGRFETDAWRIRRDGSRYWANVVLTPIHDGEAASRFVLIIRDLTDRKQAEEAVRRSEERF